MIKRHLEHDPRLLADGKSAVRQDTGKERKGSMSMNLDPDKIRIALRFLLAASLLALPAWAQTVEVAHSAAKVVPASPQHPVAIPSAAPHRPAPMSFQARDRYQLLWGIDALDVKAVESGQMIRFSYYVLDGTKALPLNDKKSNPHLIDEQARVSLDIPTMEKVGQLRQSSTPEAGRSYWMVFTNKGSLVKPGDRVSIVIGRFRADGLYVR